MSKKIGWPLLALWLLMVSCTTVQPTTKKEPLVSQPKGGPKNIIFMIVDGMGFAHVKAAHIYHGQKPLDFEQFTCQTKVTTCAYEGANGSGHCLVNSDHVTDSAAAATAIATGVKVKNGAISRQLPTEHKDVQTILELSQLQGKSTGIIATKLFTDATPAAFASHANDRDLTEEILSDMFQDVRPNVILGADTPVHRQYANQSKSPYQLVHTAKDLKNLAQQISQGQSCGLNTPCPYIYGGFGEHALIPGVYEEKSGLPLEITPVELYTELNVPHLSEMTEAALKILSKNEQGFFVMVESSMPDMISHYNAQIDAIKKSPKAIEVLIKEMLEVENTIKVIKAFVEKNPDTLVILTADHETGGLVIDEEKTACLGREHCVPQVRWTSKKYAPTIDSPVKHTNADVPLYAFGVGAERFCQEQINNTDIMKLALAK